MEHAFIFEDITNDEYKARYPKSKLSSMDDWNMVGSEKEDWFSDGMVRIAEYFYKEYEDTTIYKLSTGESVLESDILNYPIESIVSKRKTQIPKVKWCLINGIEILEEKEFPSRWIPILPVYGDVIQVEGKRI